MKLHLKKINIYINIGSNTQNLQFKNMQNYTSRQQSDHSFLQQLPLDCEYYLCCVSFCISVSFNHDLSLEHTFEHPLQTFFIFLELHKPAPPGHLRSSRMPPGKNGEKNRRRHKHTHSKPMQRSHHKPVSSPELRARVPVSLCQHYMYVVHSALCSVASHRCDIKLLAIWSCLFDPLRGKDKLHLYKLHFLHDVFVCKLQRRCV